MKYPDKRKMIMDAAIELFKEKGYLNTRIIDIADKAGIGKGTVYAYFNSKEEIVAQVIKDIMQNDFDLYIKELDGKSSLRQNIIAYLALSERVIKKYGIHAIMFKEFACFNNAINSKEILSLVEQMHKIQFHKIKQIIEKAVKDGEISEENIEQSTIFAMTAMGSYMLARLTSFGKLDSEPPGAAIYKKTTKENLADFILHGICGKEKEESEK